MAIDRDIGELTMPERQKLRFLGFFLFSTVVFSPFALSSATAPPTTEITPHFQAAPDQGLRDNRYFQKLQEVEKPKDVEKYKIMYLIEELRHSPYQFERNGDLYSSKKAAKHLLLKYGFMKNRIRTAEDFIERLGSKSSASGRDYMVWVNENESFPSEKYLSSELDALNERLQAIQAQLK